MTIAVRCRYNRHLKEYESAGADIIVDEETLMGQMLARNITEHMREMSDTAMACALAGQQPEDLS